MLEVVEPHALVIHRTFKFNPREVTMQNGEEVAVNEGEDELYLEVILRTFSLYRKLRRNNVFGHLVFRSRNQEEGKTVDQWMVDLRIQASICEFGLQGDLMLGDKVVFGIRNPRAKRMLREWDLSLQKALGHQTCSGVYRVSARGHEAVTASHGRSKTQTGQRCTESKPQYTQER